MRDIGNRDMNTIIESLNESRQDYDRFDEMNIDDTLVVTRRGRLEDAISVGLEKKYRKKFEKLGDFSVSVDIGLTDLDDYMLEDVADELVIGLSFDNENLSPEVALKELTKNIKAFKGYRIMFDKSYGDFTVTVDTQEDIEDLLDKLSKDGCDIKNFYKIVDSEEIRNNMRDAYNEYEEDRKYLEREYWRSVL